MTQFRFGLAGCAAAGAAAALGLALACVRRAAEPPPASDGPIQLHDVTGESGITFTHADGSSGHPGNGMGMVCGDYDNDGWLDFFSTSYQSPMPVLFRNGGGVDVLKSVPVDRILSITEGKAP